MPALIAVISGNADPLKKELAAVGRMAGETGRTLQHGFGGLSGVMRESLVLIREISRGNWTRVPGSLSILLGQLGLLRYILNPITIGFAALGLSVYEYVRQIIRAREAQKDFNQLMDTTHSKFTLVAQSMRTASDEAANFNNLQTGILRPCKKGPSCNVNLRNQMVHLPHDLKRCVMRPHSRRLII
jgi:hypothetical protein